MRAQNLTQRFDLGVHAIEKLFDGIDAQFSAFIAIQGEANGHVLRQFQEHGLIGFFVGRLRSKTCERLLQRKLGANGHGAQARLKGWRVHLGIGISSRLSELREESKHGADVFFGDRVLAAATSAASCRASCGRHASYGGAAQHGGSGEPFTGGGSLSAARSSSPAVAAAFPATARAATATRTATTRTARAATARAASTRAVARAERARTETATTTTAIRAGAKTQTSSSAWAAARSRACTGAGFPEVSPTGAGTTPGSTASRARATTKSGTRSTGTQSAAATTGSARARALRCQNHLQQLVGIFKEIPELVSACAQRLCGKVRSHFNAGDRRVFGDVANLVDLDAVVACKSRLQLLCERRGLGVAARKGAHKARELRLR